MQVFHESDIVYTVNVVDPVVGLPIRQRTVVQIKNWSVYLPFLNEQYEQLKLQLLR